MKYEEIDKTVLDVPQGYYLVNFISADLVFISELQKEFDKTYQMKYKLQKKYPITSNLIKNLGRALLVDNVFNLVTDSCYFQKTKYEKLYETIVDMKEQCKCLPVFKLAIPKIEFEGCGFDWNDVKDILETEFSNMDIEILVCKKNSLK